MDVSFVVITLNEVFSIKKCLNSIVNLCTVNCEVICVDSGSTDGTINIIMDYQTKISNLSLYIINGYANAAVARNVGIKNAKKNYIYFIDGDVEVQRSFIIQALILIDDGLAYSVSGRLMEYKYDAEYKKILIKVDDRYRIKQKNTVRISGGLFLAKRCVVKDIGYFDEVFEKYED